MSYKVGDDVGHVTCWPSALTVTATWDTDLFYEFCEAMGNEQRAKVNFMNTMGFKHCTREQI